MSSEEGYQTLIRQFDKWVRYFLNHVEKGDPRHTVEGNPTLARQLRQEYDHKVVRRRNGWIQMLEMDLKEYVREYGSKAFSGDSRHPAVRFKQSRQRTLEKELHLLHSDFHSWARKVHRDQQKCECKSDPFLSISP